MQSNTEQTENKAQEGKKEEKVEDKGPSKKALKKEQKKAEKQQKKQQHLGAKGGDQPEKKQQQKKKEEVYEEYVKDPSDPHGHKYGDVELNRSQSNPEDRFTRKFIAIKDMDDSHVGQKVLVRGRLHNSRNTKNLAFVIVREGFATMQAILSAGEEVSEGMLQYVKHIPRESIIDLVGVVTKPENPIKTCSQKVELIIHEIFTINKALPQLPFVLEEAMRRVENQAEEYEKEGEEVKQDEGKKVINVSQDTRLNNRVIDLRVPANQALMRMQSGVCQLFREFLLKNEFIEIHTPKLIAGASEGGASVFRLSYFGREACLAQSPQIHKQMAICSDFNRVFEIGPVFRAENANTNRHLCEFTGLDIEMAIKVHYFEVLDILADMFVFIFEGLHSRYAKELDVVAQQYPFEPFKCKVVKLDFKEAVQMLKEKKGIEQDPLQDLDTINEKALGALVKEVYDTDFYMLYRYPTNARPFYTMLDPFDPNYTNSYDFFMRGEEITSGAQRIHDPKMLTERATAHGIPLDTIKDYIDAFKYGAPPHGGCGVGLERVVKLFCGMHNIRKCSMFPRDPKRLAP